MKAKRVILGVSFILAVAAAIFNACSELDPEPPAGIVVDKLDAVTGDVTNIQRNTATCGGVVAVSKNSKFQVIARGLVWDTIPNPSLLKYISKTTEGSGVGSFQSNITGLTHSTKYYVRAYASISRGTSYGEQKEFTTLSNTMALVTTSAVINITTSSASSGGLIPNDGGDTVTVRGVCWSTSENPTIADSKTTDGSGMGSFESHLTNLSDYTIYYVRAYATTNQGTSYGGQKKFNTLGAPIVVSASVTNIQQSTATAESNVSGSGGVNVTARGVVWSTSQNPTLTNNQGKTNDGIGTGSFLSSLTGLNINTTYYVRAYATNAVGTGYGEQLTFTTLQNASPTVTTRTLSYISYNSATSGGNVSSSGGVNVTARGVVWSTSQNPTITNNQGITNDGNGTGSFSSSLTGLTANTSFYVRAYATNAIGTGYGEQLAFTTEQPILPTVFTTSLSNVTYNSATGGGNVIFDGGTNVTTRGVVWSTSHNPTITNNQGITNDGSGTGSFSSSLTELNENTTYYVRAYATNSVGTSYGNHGFITTLHSNPCHGVTPPVGYGVVGSSGKCWLDRNIGAGRVAVSSTDEQAYGDWYQWGRGSDGHQIRTSWATDILSSSNTPGHGNFILANSSPYDWRNPQNNNLWQGVNGINNPCPFGYRLPTEAEWNAERLSWSSDNADGAFASPLKLPVAGSRLSSSGYLYQVGSSGRYWSSTVDGTSSRYLYFLSSGANTSGNSRANGLSVRCLKD